MKQLFIKPLLIVQICLASAGNAGAEILRPVKFENREAWRVDSNAGITKKIKKQKSDRRKGGIWKRMKENSRDLIIFTIVLLSIGAIILGGMGALYLIYTIIYIGDIGWVGLIYGFFFLGLGMLCMIGITKLTKKPKKLKYGDPPGNLPRRPPTKRLNGR